jgi:Uracil-DNA glycosylase
MFLQMNFRGRSVPAVGDPNSRIAIVGDYSSAFDEHALCPFSGPPGTVIEQCLHMAGLIRGEVYMTNLIKTKPVQRLKDGNEFVTEKPGKVIFSPAGLDAVSALREELDATGCNVIVAAGAASFAALCDLAYISRYRGYVFPSVGLRASRKVIPIHHPGQAIRGMYTYRHMIICDLRKAKQESYQRELVRPDRKLVYSFANVEEALQWLEYFEEQAEVSVDIEVLNYEISCIGFSSNPGVAISLPVSDRWELDEELLIWRGIQRVLGNPKSVKVFQNGIFDIHFMLTRNGIVVRGPIHDTMVGHSIMYPDLPKGLGFLGSLYCGSQEYWKDSVKFTNIKDES